MCSLFLTAPFLVALKQMQQIETAFPLSPKLKVKTSFPLCLDVALNRAQLAPERYKTYICIADCFGAHH